MLLDGFPLLTPQLADHPPCTPTLWFVLPLVRKARVGPQNARGNHTPSVPLADISIMPVVYTPSVSFVVNQTFQHVHIRQPQWAQF